MNIGNGESFESISTAVNVSESDSYDRQILIASKTLCLCWSLVMLWLLISLVVYGTQTGKLKVKRLTNHGLPLLLPLTLMCVVLAVAAFFPLFIFLFSIGYVANDQFCRSVFYTLITFSSLHRFVVEIAIWTRHKALYSQPALLSLLSPTMKRLSRLSLFIIITSRTFSLLPALFANVTMGTAIGCVYSFRTMTLTVIFVSIFQISNYIHFSILLAYPLFQQLRRRRSHFDRFQTICRNKVAITTVSNIINNADITIRFDLYKSNQLGSTKDKVFRKDVLYSITKWSAMLTAFYIFTDILFLLFSLLKDFLAPSTLMIFCSKISIHSVIVTLMLRDCKNVYTSLFRVFTE